MIRDKNMKVKICLAPQNNCIITKFQISYRFLKDIRGIVLNTSIRWTGRTQFSNHKSLTINFQGIPFYKKLFSLS